MPCQGSPATSSNNHKTPIKLNLSKMKNNLYSMPTVALIAVVFFLASCTSEPDNSLNGGTRSKVLAVDYMVTQPQPLANIIEVTGSVLPNESAQLTTQVAG